MEQTENAKLYLVPTPLGNLADITERAMSVMKLCDEIYCEDTRNSLKLLNALGIKKTLISCHQHNEQQRADEILNKVMSGRNIAYISDAGMPGISDPGSRIIAKFIENNMDFEVLPGGTAAMTAWIMSGLPSQKLYFCGFLPRGGSERKQEIENIKATHATIVIYESPQRVADTLTELAIALDNPKCALVREISKLFEETVRGNCKELAEKYCSEPPKGECVIVVDNNEGKIDDGDGGVELMKLLLEAGCSCRDAARIAEYALKQPGNKMYKLALKLNKERENDDENL